MDRNGVCKKNNDHRKHTFSKKKDGADREYTSCDKCGTIILGEITEVLA